MDKASLRAAVRTNRASRTQSDVESDGLLLAERLVELQPPAPSDVTCYAALGGEPPTDRLMLTLLSAGHRVWLPRIRVDELDWVQVTAHTSYLRGPLGISEPIGDAASAPTFASMMLIPALAVDERGHRLGQGRGYFDRALQEVTSWRDGGPLLVAVVFDDEVVTEVPTEPHDRAVDAVLTPRRVLFAKRP